MKFALLAWIALLTSALPAHAYIGGRSPKDQLPSAVKIVMSGYACSATRVSPKMILTAAHCNVEGSLNAGREVTLIDSYGVAQPGHFIKQKVKSFNPHPTWVPSKRVDPTLLDLALVEFDDLSIFKEMPISLVPVALDDRVVVGGFGCQGLGYPRQPQIMVAIKRVREIAFDLFSVGLDDDTGDGRQSFACHGDSGGGAYRINPATKQLELVGVNVTVTHNETYFKVDPKTGQILSAPEDPQFSMTQLGIEAATDKQGTVAWLRQYLPASSFTGEQP